MLTLWNCVALQLSTRHLGNLKRLNLFTKVKWQRSVKRSIGTCIDADYRVLYLNLADGILVHPMPTVGRLIFCFHWCWANITCSKLLKLFIFCMRVG